MKIGEVWKYWDQGESEVHVIVLMEYGGKYPCQPDKPHILTDLWEYKTTMRGSEKITDEAMGTINADHLYETGIKIAESEYENS